MATTRYSGDPHSTLVSNWPIDQIIDFEYPVGGYPVRQLKKNLLEAKRYSASMRTLTKSELIAVATTQLNTRMASPLSAFVLAIKDVLPEKLDLTNADFMQGLHELIRAIDDNRDGIITKSETKRFAENPPAKLKAELARKMGVH